MNFLNSLVNNSDHKNVLLQIISRELIMKGNLLNVDGQCLSVKQFVRDWDTSNLVSTLTPSQPSKKKASVLFDIEEFAKKLKPSSVI